MKTRSYVSLIVILYLFVLQGYLPTTEALTKYDLTEFGKVSEALKDGNIKNFKLALEKSEAKFIKAGVYLILEKLHFMLYRNLFKKV